MITLNRDEIAYFHRRGFLVLESLFENDLHHLRRDCDNCVAKTVERDSNSFMKGSTTMQAFSKIAKTRGCIIEPMNLAGISTESRTNKDAYTNLRLSCLPCTTDTMKVLFGSIFKSIITQLLSSDSLFLLNEQYVVKPPNTSESIFDYHQDSEYMPSNKVPYVSCWVALDDMSEENGTLYIVPFTKNDPDKLSSLESVLHHHSSCATHYKSKDYYEENAEDHIEDGIEIPMLVPAGSVVILSSFVLHRSSKNTANTPRRAYLPQYSALPILKDNEPLAFAIPL